MCPCEKILETAIQENAGNCLLLEEINCHLGDASFGDYFVSSSYLYPLRRWVLPMAYPVFLMRLN